MKNIQDHKKEAVLNKVYIYPEGTMSRRDFIILQKSKGFLATEKVVKNYAAMEKLEAELKRTAFSYPFGNTSHPATVAYNKKKALLKEGIFKTVYRLENEKYVNIITKTEFDFFNSLNN
jgi:hypothetical protein